MKEEKKQREVAKLVDCRTCQNYIHIHMCGRCYSTATCVLADQYKGKDFIQLWSINHEL